MDIHFYHAETPPGPLHSLIGHIVPIDVVHAPFWFYMIQYPVFQCLHFSEFHYRDVSRTYTPQAVNTTA